MCQISVPGNPVPSPARALEGGEIDRYFLPFDDNTQRSVFQAPDALTGVGDYDPNIGGNYQPVQPPENPPPAGTAFASLQQILEAFPSQDWRERGNPPNPNIAEAWEVAGGGRMSVDGPKTNPWCAAFVTWVLWKCGLEHIVPGMGSQSYLRYGKSVDWRDFTKIRKYDLVVLTRKEESRYGHVGFVHSIDPAANRIRMFGGNQSNGKNPLSNFRIVNRETTGLYLNQIRRNWEIPAGFDIPLITIQPEQNTSGPPSSDTGVYETSTR